MTKPIRYFVAATVMLAWMLSVSSSVAQNKIAERLHKPRATPLSAPIVVPKSQPDGSSYTYTLFDFPGTFYTFGVGLNVGAIPAKVEIVGGYGNAFVLGNRSFRVFGSENNGIVTEAYQSLNALSAPEQGAYGVNDSGQIVGEYRDSAGVFHGWALNGAAYTTIDVPFPGATGTASNGINDSGEIAGGWDGSGIEQHGFTLIGGTYTSFDYPGAIQTFAWALNNHGDIVGYYTDSDNVLHGFVRSGGTFTSIDPPASTWTVPQGINDAGDVVGSYCVTADCITTLNGLQGFLLSHGTYTTFTIAGATGTSLSGINDKGLILGSFNDASGFGHNFVAVP